DTSINDLSSVRGSTRTQSRLNSARSSLPAFSSSTTSCAPCREIFSPSVAWRAYTQNAAPTTSNSSQANGMISVAPLNQNTPLMPKDRTQSEAYTHVSSTGDTEQLRLRNH